MKFLTAGVFPSISFRSWVSFPSANIDTVLRRVYLVFLLKRVCSLMCIQKIVLVWVGFLLYTGTGVPSRIRFPQSPKAALRWILFVLLRIGFGVKACCGALCSNCLGYPMVHKKSSSARVTKLLPSSLPILAFRTGNLWEESAEILKQQLLVLIPHSSIILVLISLVYWESFEVSHNLSLSSFQHSISK